MSAVNKSEFFNCCCFILWVDGEMEGQLSFTSHANAQVCVSYFAAAHLFTGTGLLIEDADVQVEL